ncbi:hypothetical protein [Acidianus sp. RZ1]|nr:hypothetical protein [Acidianus sp. RZ1]NON63064.1 hypothetical protein [Acidianus sp. RZ1]
MFINGIERAQLMPLSETSEFHATRVYIMFSERSLRNDEKIKSQVED